MWKTPCQKWQKVVYTLWNWYREFNWKQQSEERLVEINKVNLAAR